MDDLRGKLPGNARALRVQLARWVAGHPDLRLADTPLASWVKWDSGLATKAYADRMGQRGWGGGIEIAACSHAYEVNIWIYEKRRQGFERISTFDSPAVGGRSGRHDGSHTVHVVYQGGCHYDALLPEPGEIETALKSLTSHSHRSKSPQGHAQRGQQQQQRGKSPQAYQHGGQQQRGKSPLQQRSMECIDPWDAPQVRGKGKGGKGKGGKGSPGWNRGHHGRGSPGSWRKY